MASKETPKKRVTVLIGRFSPFHNGHATLLKRALDTSDEVIVLIGSSGQARTTKNPFSCYERAAMIQQWFESNKKDFKQGHINVQPLFDHPYNDDAWVSQVRDVVYTYCPKSCDIYITGADRDDSCWYLDAFPEWKQDLMTDPLHDYALSATQVRDKLFGLRSWELQNLQLKYRVPPTTLSFLENFIKTHAYQVLQEEYDFVAKYKQSWSTAPYAPTFVTVDGVVLHSGHVLLVERRAAPGKGLWALPGGFVNQDERLEAAVIRELIEETCIPIKPEALKRAITDKEIFDLPGRSLRGRTITTAYRFELRKTGPLPEIKGSDDAAKAFWVPVNEALSRTDVWFEDHHAILETMVNRITTT